MNRKRLLHIAGTVLLLALVVPFVVYAAPGVAGADQSFVILSGSMEPEMSPGDAVIVDDRSPGSIEEGDVITFSRDGSDTVVTHRVVDVRDEGGQRVFETKGDANDATDREPVPASNVVGTVILTIPLIGYVVHFVNTPLGFAATVLLPLGLLVLSEVWAFVQDASDDPAAGAADADGSDSDGRSGSVADGGTVVAGGGDTPIVDAAASTDAHHEVETGSEESETSPAGQITIEPNDVAATTIVLVLATPYAAYVAFQLQTMVTIGVAYTIGFSAFALVALQVVSVLKSRQGAGESRDSSTTGTDPLAFNDRTATSENDPTGEDERPDAPMSEFEWADRSDGVRTEGGDS